MKKAECQIIDTFKLWCWRRLLRVPCTARRSNQSILKEISPENSLEGLKLKLNLQYFGHLMWRIYHWKRPWCWERLKAGGEGNNRWWDGWMASPIRWTWVWASSGSWWWPGKLGMLQSMGSQRVEHDWSTELNWSLEFLVWSYKWKNLDSLSVAAEGLLSESVKGMFLRAPSQPWNPLRLNACSFNQPSQFVTLNLFLLKDFLLWSYRWLFWNFPFTMDFS